MKQSELGLDCHGAVFSENGLYRYELRRRWGHGDLVLWIMLNPSTADKANDDPTIRRCIRFSQQWGFGGLVVCNIFAYRSTDPKAILKLDDITASGPENWRTIIAVARECSRVVCGWGANGKLHGKGRKILRALLEEQLAPSCLGITTEGQPKHPLYIPYSQNLIALGGILN